MAALRSSMQKSLFQQDGERLLAVASLKKDGGKARKSTKEVYMCLVVTTAQPVSARIYLVKAEKDGGNHHQQQLNKKEQFALRDVRNVDGLNPRKPIPDFNLTIQNQLYQLSSNTHEEKEFFIRQLFKLANAYLPVQKPEFVNVSLPVDMVANSENSAAANDLATQTSAGAEEEENDGMKDAELDSNYQPITSKEEADFRRLLQKAELQIGQARQFSSALNNQLAQLDSANLSSIMDNEQNVRELIELIDTAVELADRLEQQLDEYDGFLSFVRESVELIEEKDILRHTEQQNNRRLLEALKQFVYLVDTVNDQQLEALRSANLSDPISQNLCCQAARVVDHFLSKRTDLGSMHAYQSRVEQLQRLTSEFVDRFYAHISAIFGNMDTLLQSQPSGIIIQKHSHRHRALLAFSDLIAWLKQTRPAVYRAVLDKYNGEAQKIYKREFDRFFSELAKEAAAAAGQSSMDQQHQQNSSGSQQQQQMMRPLDGLTLDKYSNLIKIAVAECRTVVESEQKFCIRFFHLNNIDVLTQLGAEMAAGNDASGGTPNSNSSGSQKTLERQINGQIKFAIGRIFEALPTYFYGLVSICKDHHSSIIISLYVLLTRRLNAFCEPSSYFSIIYGSFLVALKRLFDEQMTQIEDSFARGCGPILRKGRIGILESVGCFRALASTAVATFGDSERRVDLDKWLEKLSDAVLQGIDQAAASPHSKCPAAIVRMENQHAFYSVLSELKIPCLDTRRKAVRQRYQENVDVYVRELMGRPLEKIHLFFEKIERFLENGVRPEEIGYEQQFSRMELKRAIQAYPAKEVKNGLDALYRKVEKHLSGNDSPLLQVVWRQMQEEFLNQVKHYQQLISRCYPGAKIELEVRIDQILRFFSEIAQQH